MDNLRAGPRSACQQGRGKTLAQAIAVTKKYENSPLLAIIDDLPIHQLFQTVQSTKQVERCAYNGAISIGIGLVS